MYAVIATGGKQYKVEAGQQLEVERLGVDDGASSSSRRSSSSTATPCSPRPAQLGGATVKAKVVGDGQGPEDRRLHLQAEVEQPASAGATARTYSMIEITAITKG